ncbi:MAG: DUF4349 domain-containing protein [Bacteroidetes bacterium]|nr:MAG: DUF4349 domain-containing protein [Bacteroidota bacterium]
MNSYLLSFVFFLMLSSCQHAADSTTVPEAAVEYEASDGGESGQYTKAQQQVPLTDDAPPPPSAPTLLLRAANCRLRVDSLELVLAKLERLAGFYEGYVAEVDIQNEPYKRRAQLSVRIPTKYFALTLDSLQAWASTVEYQHISTTDVTEEYVDLKSRLDTKKAVRDRYLSILRNQAKTVEEILLAEEKIRILQEEIEVKEGRLRYLENRAALSTIHVEMYQPAGAQMEVHSGWLKDLGQDIWYALRAGGQMLRFLFLALLYLWPLLIIAVLIWWKRKRIFRRWHKG